MATYTQHSEYGVLKSVILKSPEAAFVDESKISREWQELNYLSCPDFSRAKEEYRQFTAIFTRDQVEVNYLPVDLNQTMDSMYCRDAAIATKRGLILCNMGKNARRNEPAAMENIARSLQIPVLGSIRGSGTVEGGDVAWMDENTLVAGHSYRTNLEGIRQLRELLLPLAVKVIRVDLPHYRGPGDVFHLMSVYSPVAPDVAVVYSPLLPISFRNLLIACHTKLVEVPATEFETMGCNVLAISPYRCLMVEGNPETVDQLQAAGCEVMTFSGVEICLKGGGGPTCLTRPLLRGY